MVSSFVSALLLFAAAWAPDLPQEPVPIADVCVDADHDGFADRAGEVVRVFGAVTAAPFPAFRSDEREYRFYIEDDSGGVRVVQPSLDGLLELTAGVAVELEGEVGQYNGMPVLRLVRILRITSSPGVVPRDVRWESFDGEALCGSLVSVHGPISYEDKRYFIGEGDDRIRLFLRPSKEYVPFVSEIGEGYEVEVVGIVEQFSSKPPFQGGYRLRPRGLPDVMVVVPFLARREFRVGALVGLGCLVALFGWLALRWRRAKSELEAPEVQRMHALGTMAGGVAHEFNNYLLAIVGFAELAREELPAGAAARGHLDEVLAASGRAKALIEQILSYSRTKDGELDRVDAAEAVREGLRLVRAVMPATVEVVERFATDLGSLAADRGQLNQVLLNLGTNASRAMPNGGTFTVGMERVEIDDNQRRDLRLPCSGAHLLLEVSDTGGGMTEDVRDRVFDPFYTTRERAEGTGLGLSVVHGIVKRHRGAIAVESTVGKGTAFKIYLPVAQGSEPLASEPAGEEAVVVAPGTLSNAGRVLLVDDQRNLTRLVERLFERMGFEVMTANDGMQAFALVARDPAAFSLIVSDLTMPKMSGLELARRVRELREDLPFLLMTGNASSLDHERLVDVGVDAVLTKPFGGAELAAEVGRLVGAAGGAQA